MTEVGSGAGRCAGAVDEWEPDGLRPSRCTHRRAGREFGNPECIAEVPGAPLQMLGAARRRILTSQSEFGSRTSRGLRTP